MRSCIKLHDFSDGNACRDNSTLLLSLMHAIVQCTGVEPSPIIRECVSVFVMIHGAMPTDQDCIRALIASQPLIGIECCCL